jgi:hypothetical protein
MYINNLTHLLPDKLIPQKEIINELISNLPEDSIVRDKMEYLSTLGIDSIGEFPETKKEHQIVSDCLDKLFMEVDKESIKYFVHCSPTATCTDSGGLIGGMEYEILKAQKMNNTTFIPLLGGCASLEPVLNVTCSLAKSNNTNVLCVISLMSSKLRQTINKEKILQRISTAIPYAIFGDSCVAFIVSNKPMGKQSFEIIETKFKYNTGKYVAKAYFEKDLIIELKGTNQKYMLIDYLLEEINIAQKKYDIEFFFIHNQIPKVFLEIIKILNIPIEKAPLIVNTFGNLACSTAIINLAENADKLNKECIIGLFSAGEHTGISESTSILKNIINK